MVTKKTHGGAGRGQGRKPVEPGADTQPVSIRLTAMQREKLKRLGGPPWVRTHINEAKEPGEK